MKVVVDVVKLQPRPMGSSKYAVGRGTVQLFFSESGEGKRARQRTDHRCLSHEADPDGEAPNGK